MTDLNINGNILGTRNDGGTTNEIKLTISNPDGTINKDLLPEIIFKFLEPFKVPYLHQTKEEIWEKTVKYGYDEPLYDTWTCFFLKVKERVALVDHVRVELYQMEWNINLNLN